MLRVLLRTSMPALLAARLRNVRRQAMHARSVPSNLLRGLLLVVILLLRRMRVSLRCWRQLASVRVLSRRLHALLLRRCHRRRLVLLLHVATATPSIVMRWRPRLLLRVASPLRRNRRSVGAAPTPVAAAAAATIPACSLRRHTIVPAPISTCAAAAATAVLSLIAIALRPVAAATARATSYAAHMLRSSLCILLWRTVAVPARAAEAVVLPAVPVVMLPRVAAIAAPVATPVPHLCRPRICRLVRRTRALRRRR